MKKIGILTHPLISNYGGILQNYALQQVLEKEGYYPITINRVYKLSSFRILLSKLKQIFFRHHSNKILSLTERAFLIRNSQLFINEKINKVDLINPSDSELVDCIVNNGIDTLVVGSDQVWRPSYVRNIYHEFFSFLPNDSEIKRVSYAASFGTDKCEYTEKQLSICSELLRRFNAVSVREQSANQLCSMFFNRNDVNTVLDPTLLLEKEEYQKIIKNRLKDKKGVYTYILDSTESKNELIDRVCLQLGFNNYNCQPKFSLVGSKDKSANLNDYVFPPIEDWIEGFYRASFVVTDSFHGTVFAILFNKPFIAVANVERGKTRFNSLLKLFGLENRLISSVDELTDELINEKIDFDYVNLRHIELRNISIKFIKDNI